MSGRLQNETDDQLLTVVEKPCVCIHGLGVVRKGHGDFRTIVDCSSPVGICVNGIYGIYAYVEPISVTTRWSL